MERQGIEKGQGQQRARASEHEEAGKTGGQEASAVTLAPLAPEHPRGLKTSGTLYSHTENLSPFSLCPWLAQKLDWG